MSRHEGLLGRFSAGIGLLALGLVLGLGRPAAAQEVVKPYFVVIVDNSGSMNDKVADGLNSCGQERSRMSDAKCALQRVVNAYGDATFALARFQETTSGTCGAIATPEDRPSYCTGGACSFDSSDECSYWRQTSGGDYRCGDCSGDECTDGCYFFECNNAENYSCPATCNNCAVDTLDCFSCTESSGAGCPATGSNADRGEILVPLGEENQDEIVRWVDFSCDTCSVTGGGDPELGADTYTPIAGSLRGARRYYQGNDPRFPGSPITADPYKACRPYRVILLTDGDESCAAYTQGPIASTELRTTPVGGTNYDIRTYTIGFDLDAGATTRLSSIASSGGTTTTFSATDETSIALAFSQIIEDSILVEICDGDDDDCDGLIDEGFTKYCNRPAGITALNLCADPGDPCDGVDDNCFDGINDEILNACGTCGPTPAEICNTIDDDCDGFINEGGVCGGCVPQAEVCDNLDNDCDGAIDEMLTRECGTAVGACTVGVEMCTAGAWLGCTATVGTPETCNNIDDDCDGVVDGFAQACGPPETGECQPGVQVCLAGAFGECTGGIGPITEICDRLDNDCDASTDEGATGAGVVCNTACGPGTTACVDGGLVCVGGGSGFPEVCDGLDNDCNGLIDDGLPTMGPCTEDGALCVPGVLTCSEGSYQCVGGSPTSTEVCDCIDNDCDLATDEGDLCGPNATCLAGPYCGCARACTSEEFPCPLGFSCTTPETPLDGFCVPDECATVSCPPVAGVAQVCLDGGCVDACSQVSCTPPFLCRGTDGICVPDSCSFFPDRCTADEVCIDATCVSNPCAVTECGDLTCANGACVPSCAGVDCPDRQSCSRGECFEDPCGGVYCPAGQACDQATGGCVEDFCDVVVCRTGQECDPVTGDCLEDLCALVDCPTGQVCAHGDCFNPGDLQPPVPPQYVSASGGGGFSCGVAPGRRGTSSPVGPLGLLLLGAAVVAGFRLRSLRQLASRVALGALLVVVAAPLAGCKTDGYCVTCGVNGDGGDGDGGGDPMDGLVNRDATITDACLPTGPEVCDGRDNDCDLEVDEGTLADVGVACGTDEGPCEPGRTVCTDGVISCGEGAIAPTAEGCDGIDNDCDGVIDDGDPGGSASCGDSVGECSPGLSRCVSGDIVCEGGIQPGIEDCDGRDDDCDGLIDDGNPGGGVACGVAVGTCAPGTTRCSGGAIVCEGAGTPTIEACDTFDNDCDGMIDEDFDKTTDPRHCGVCGNACAGTVLNARATCAASTCVVQSCNTNFWNLDGDNQPTDVLGCEYACVFRGVEICNGEDDDCDGATDEGLVPPAICNGVGACAGTVASCDGDEGWVCHYPATVVTDVLGGIVPEGDCDGVDDDCDGVADDSFTAKGDDCTRGLGACTTEGTLVCNGAGTDLLCDAATPPTGTTEICDGIDNDCDGTDDELAPDSWVQFTTTSGPSPGNRWIYQYEASRPDATGSNKGVRTHRPCSAVGRLPWTNVTQPQAEAACAAIPGARLCTEAEWQRACQTSAGTACEYSYSAMCTVYADNTCNGNDYDPSATAGDQDQVLASGALAQCRSVWTGGSIFDLSGNVKEWTAERGAGVNPLRGGSYNNTGGGLQCDFNFLVADDTFQFENVGFRCCRSTAPP